MAKKEEKYKYPSRFGSHLSMVNVDETEKLRINGDTDRVVCTDEYGDYITLQSRLDNGDIDWARAKGSRVRYEKEERGKKHR